MPQRYNFLRESLLSRITKTLPILLFHLIHPSQFPAIKLHDDLVQFSVLAQRFYPWSCGISLDLVLGMIDTIFKGEMPGGQVCYLPCRQETAFKRAECASFRHIPHV